MSGGNIFEAGDQLHVAPVQVPIGWQRKAEPSEGVLYISPSGSVLASYDDVKAYVLSDGTCKCGLECPFSLRKVFNFDLEAPVKQRTAEDVRADVHVTKLCTHKRKLLAVTELHRSIESHRPLNPMGTPPLFLGAALPVTPHCSATQDTGTTPHVCQHCSTTPATGTTPHAGPPSQAMLPSGQQHQQQRPYSSRDAAGAFQPDPFPVYQRQLRFLESGSQSPYRDNYGGMLSQPPFSSKSYGDGLCSPAADALGSPKGFLGHHGSGQGGFPGASSAHGNTGGPSACAMAGRTSTPLSPMAVAKSPEVNTPHGMEVPLAAFPRKPQLPSLTMQTRSMTSEKDPLGILDPIPDKHVGQVSAIPPNPSSFQPSLHSQVPVMNVNAPPPAVVPLPSNLPLPTGKPASVGHMGHVQRSQQAAPSPSMSPSPVASPVHAQGRMEASPHRSRPASASACTSLDHGNFAVPSGHQAHPGSMKVPPRSPRSTMGSPHLAMSSSPSPNAAELLDQLLETQITNLVGAQPHNNTVYSPTSSSFSSQSASPKGHSGLAGVPLNQILNQQKAAPFPASTLLSAAAKAQLVNQNKHVAADNGTGGDVNEAGGSQSGLLTGTGGMEGQSTLNPMLPPNSTVPLNTSEPQSGRAMLRDKLMAQQREASRKRRLSSGVSASNLSDNVSYRMLRQHGMGTHRRPSPSELLWQVSRTGALPPNTSMAQLLQTMSSPGYHNMAGHDMSVSQGPPDPAPAQKTPQGPGPPPLQHHQSMDQEMMTQMQASSVGSSGPVRPAAGPDGMPLGHAASCPSPVGHAGSCPSPLGHAGSCPSPVGHTGSCPSPLSCPGHSPQQQSLLHHDVRRTNMAAMAHGVGDGSCGPVNTGQIPPGLSCGPDGMQSLGNSSGGAQMYQQPVPQHQQFQQGVPHPAQLPALPYQGQQHFPDDPPYPDGTIVDPMTWAYQNYQQGMMANHSQYGDEQLQLHQELSTPVERLPAVPLGNDGFPDGSNCSQAMDAIYRAVVDAARKGVHVTITTTVTETTQATPLSALGTFAAPVSEPAGPPRTEAPLRSRRAQMALPQNTLDPAAGTLELVTGPAAAEYFGSPGHGTPRGLWDSESQQGGGFDGQSFGIVAPWGTEEFLECSTEVRSGPCMERPASLVSSPPGPTEAFYDHLKGYPGGASGYNNFNIVPRQELTGDDRSPGSSTSLDGPLAVGREYGRYNGHYRGTATSPSDTKSLSSEEELRHPDSPASELLPYGTRNMGKLMWGPLNGFPRWRSRLAVDQLAHGNTALLRREEGMVEPENLKTLTHEMGAVERSAKRPRRANKRNSHLEAALHEAMSELDKISGTVHQVPSRERQVRPPKRRKISR